MSEEPISSHDSADRLERSLTMSWQDLALPVFTSGILMLGCFLIGHWGFSVIWIVILTGLYLLKTRMWILRQEARLNMRKQILRERGAMSAGNRNDELPNWLRYPDAERVEWLNQLLQQLWPFISEYATTFLREFIEPQVVAQMPNPFKSFKFLEIDLGDLPCRVSSLKVYTHNVGRDRIIVDLDVAYAGDAEFKVKVCGFTGGMNELVMSGRVRCVLEPLIPRPPMIAGISGSFVELPKFDFNLTGMGDFLQLPLLITAIRSVINAQMANLCVLPNSIVVPLVPDVNVTRLYVPLPDGIVRMKVVEAGNLENKDVSIITKDKSDPYCELQVGSQLFKTRTVNNNLDPQFDEYFEAVVDQASAQKLRLNMFDKDTTGADEELGRLSIPMAYVQKSKVISQWFNMEACRHGQIYLKMFWCELSPRPLNPKAPIPYADEWTTANRPVHSSLMVVFVDNVKDLPYPKSNVEPSPILELTVSNATQRTPVKVRTVNPVYMSKFLFLLQSNNKDLQELTIKALDSNTNKLLGELSIQLAYIMEQPNMEIFDKVYQLRHGVHSSNITLTIRIRHIIPPSDSGEIPKTDLEHYANASYIERANESENANIRTNGDAFAPEPGKQLETDPNSHPESSTQLNPSRFTVLERQPSTASSNVTASSRDKKFKLFRRRKNQRRESGQPSGLLQYGLRYNDKAFFLILDINSGKNLLPITTDNTLNPYVSIKLVNVTNQMVKSKKRTRIVENASSNPIFDSRFEFMIPVDELKDHKFVIVLKDRSHYGILTKAPTIGVAEILLHDFNITNQLRDQWLQLEIPSQ
ncbi:Extended synaptotagmin-2 [Aphelenchoides besseyi]|nr:Extended synaptotagmin-2 [Aphelenchoides besseyi]